jgi:hypothetical protein
MDIKMGNAKRKRKREGKGRSLEELIDNTQINSKYRRL